MLLRKSKRIHYSLEGVEASESGPQGGWGLSKEGLIVTDEV